MQLINSSVYEKESLRKASEARSGQNAKSKRQNQLINSKLDSTTSGTHQLVINGLRYDICDGGSKLIRVKSKRSAMPKFLFNISAPNDLTTPTPKNLSVSGVAFTRSKHGNLYRSGIVKSR
jgi:hypothetical protein